MILLLFSCLIATISASCNVTVRLTTEPTTITSPNYPNNYPNMMDCWWKVVSTHEDSIYLIIEDLVMENSTNCHMDYLEIFSGPSQSNQSSGHLCQPEQTGTVNIVTAPIYIRFHSDEGAAFRGFRLKARERYSARNQLLQQAVKLECTAAGWLAELNTTVFTSVFPDTDVNNIYMSNHFCTGHMRGDLLVFNSSYIGCNTGVKESQNSVIMDNYLIEYVRDNQTQLVTGSKWRYDLSCYLRKNETDSLSFVPVDNNTLVFKTTDQVPTNQADIKFFSDAGYIHPMTANPLKVALGTRVYVQVEEPNLPDNIKLIVNSCDVSGDLNDANSTGVPLIKNRCEANQFTHILGSVPRLARFYFDVFEMHHARENLYVKCDISFCSMLDFSPQCQNICQRTNP